MKRWDIEHIRGKINGLMIKLYKGYEGFLWELAKIPGTVNIQQNR